MIKSVNNQIFIIENYLHRDTCNYLTKCFEKRLQKTDRLGIFGGPSFSKKQKNDGLSDGQNIFSYDHIDEINIGMDILAGITYRIEKTISDYYNEDYYTKSIFFSKMIEGGKNEMHMDNWYQNQNDELRPRPYNKLDRSALLYLNEDYAGGEIYFPVQNFLIKPKAGTLIFFEGNYDTPHEVRPVQSGERYNIISFYGNLNNFSIDTNTYIEDFNLNEKMFNINENFKIIEEYEKNAI